MSGDNLPPAGRGPQAKEIRPSKGFNQKYPVLKEDKKMKSMTKVFMVLALVAVICLPGMAMADYTFGSIGLLDNYPAAWLGNGPNIDKIDTYITGGSVTFASSGILADGQYGYATYFAGWTGQEITNTNAIATTGTPSSTVIFDYKFAGSPSSTFTMDVNFYNSGVFQLHEHGVYTAAGAILSDVYDSNQYTAIPLPPTVLLLGSGLLGLVGLGWRRKKS
jgi:hypothetical protein